MTFVAVAELLTPSFEFSVFVAIPAGVVVGALFAAAVLFGVGGADDSRQRSLATALGSFAVAFLVGFAVSFAVVGVGAALSILVGLLVGTVGGIVAYGRRRRTAVRE